MFYFAGLRDVAVSVTDGLLPLEGLSLQPLKIDLTSRWINVYH
ncbi:MAG: hypothetical protein OXN17_15115 [Candidatus Poribacteria bacterium]|nr:hypothetical protein [Candidatus Poribacteria bacterium]MDE0505663.1 hypothetical protein [Candidatus Poribacteria bacterium]